MENKLQKIYITYYYLFIAQDLWQVLYQILSIIFLKEFIELNVNTNITIENVKLVEVNMSIATVFSNTQILKMIIMEYKCLCFNKTYQRKFHEKLKVRFFHGYKISNHDNNKFILLLWKGACPNVHILMNIWMLQKNSMKHHHFNKTIFSVTLIWKILLMQIMHTQKEFEKILK